MKHRCFFRNNITVDRMVCMRYIEAVRSHSALAIMPSGWGTPLSSSFNVAKQHTLSFSFFNKKYRDIHAHMKNSCNQSCLLVFFCSHSGVLNWCTVGHQHITAAKRQSFINDVWKVKNSEKKNKKKKKSAIGKQNKNKC